MGVVVYFPNKRLYARKAAIQNRLTEIDCRNWADVRHEVSEVVCVHYVLVREGYELRQVVELANGTLFLQHVGDVDYRSSVPKNEWLILEEDKARTCVGDQWRCTYGKKVSGGYSSIADGETLIAIELVMMQSS